MQQFVTFLQNHSYLSLAFIAVFLAVMILEFIRQKNSAMKVNATELTFLINRKNATVIDLRSDEQYKAGHIVGAHSIPASDFPQKSKKVDRFKNNPIVLVCNQGLESSKIASQLLQLGFDVRILAGGMKTWIDASLPVVKE